MFYCYDLSWRMTSLTDRVGSGQKKVTCVHLWVNTWMAGRLWAGKPSRYVTSHLGQLSLPSLRGR